MSNDTDWNNLRDVVAASYGRALEVNYFSQPLASRIAHLHSEVSELFEALRLPPGAPSQDKPGLGLSAVAEEVADGLLILFSIGAHLGVDVSEALRKKHEFNLTRSSFGESR